MSYPPADHFTQPVDVRITSTDEGRSTNPSGSGGTAPAGQGPGTQAAMEQALNQYLTSLLTGGGTRGELPVMPGNGGGYLIQSHNARVDMAGQPPTAPGGVPVAVLLLAVVAVAGGVYIATTRKKGKK